MAATVMLFERKPRTPVATCAARKVWKNGLAVLVVSSAAGRATSQNPSVSSDSSVCFRYAAAPSEPKPIPMVTRAGPERLASYVTGVIATLVAIGGLYLVKPLEATTAVAVVAVGAVAICLARTSAKLVMLQGGGYMGSCVPEGTAELRRSWPVLVVAIPPVLSRSHAAPGSNPAAECKLVGPSRNTDTLTLRRSYF
jgi:hypothetical protein